MPAPAPPTEPKSFFRAFVGVSALLLSIIIIPVGFVLLVTGIQGGGDRARAMAAALGVLAIGGGLMALGVSLLIWEMSVRYGVRK
jgi:hypothetical protein